MKLNLASPQPKSQGHLPHSFVSAHPTTEIILISLRERLAKYTRFRDTSRYRFPITQRRKIQSGGVNKRSMPVCREYVNSLSVSLGTIITRLHTVRVSVYRLSTTWNKALDIGGRSDDGGWLLGGTRGLLSHSWEL